MLQIVLAAHSRIAKPEMQAHLSQLHNIAMVQHLALNPSPIDPGSIGGIQITDLKCTIRQMVNLGVMARN